MTQTRRNFIGKVLAATPGLMFSLQGWGKDFSFFSEYESKPWIELSKSAYLHNAAQISKMANGKPVVAVLKNNAYGLGAGQVARLLDDSPHIYSMAVVKDTNALEMRSHGVTKPILLMGDFDGELANELVKQGITLSIHSQDSLEKITAVANGTDQKIEVALYIDTGLGRMGIRYQQVENIAEQVSQQGNLAINQTFSTLTTPKDFANDQILRFQKVVKRLENRGISLGVKHLAPSYSLIDLPNSHEDAVRPGILLHGSFPVAKMEAAELFPLQVPYRLKAPVIRLEKLRKGDTIGFSRFYKVEQDEWIATLPVGWADGYYSGAENGAKVLLGDSLYNVVNVNASHANISLGSTTSINIGDVATLIGPDRPEITPEGFANLADGHNYLQINYKETIPKKVYESF